MTRMRRCRLFALAMSLATRSRWNCAVVLLLAVAPIQANASQAGPEPAPEQPQLRRIRAGESDAIDEAGASGNKNFVSVLRSLLNDKKYRKMKTDPVTHARIALARLGEVDQLQAFWCAAIGTGAKVPVMQLEPIGGWFWIQAMRNILDGAASAGFEKWVRTKTLSDVSEVPPDHVALQSLIGAMPSRPEGMPTDVHSIRSSDEARFSIEWRHWIEAHRAELQMLAPTGEGVDWSPDACRNGRPVKPKS